jgi:predicted ArsR family transcriptional regulator
MSSRGRPRLVSDDEYIRAVRSLDRPAALVEDIVSRTGVSDETVRKHMKRLADEGRIEIGRANGKEDGRLLFWTDD